MVDGEKNLRAGVIDPAGQYAYFGLDSPSSPIEILKIRLSDGSRIGAINVTSVEGFRSAVIDPTGAFAYFNSYAAPSKIVRVRLSNFTRVGALNLGTTFDSWEWNFVKGLMDPARQYAYFVAGSVPGNVVKIRLSNFTRVGNLSLRAGEMSIGAAIIDPAGRYAYFGTDQFTGVIVKVRLSDFRRVESYTIPWADSYLNSAVIGPSGRYGNFGTVSNWPSDPASTIYKIDLIRDATLPDLTVSPQTPKNDTLIDTAYQTLTVKVTSRSPTVPVTGSNVTIYVNGAPICTNKTTPATGLVSCPYEVTAAGEFYWNATAEKTGTFNPTEVPQPTFKFTSGQVESVDLVSGWNLTSLPLVPASTQLGKVLGAQIAVNDVTAVWSCQDGKWSSATLTGGTLSGPLTSMEDGFGDWVYMTQPDRLYVTGSVIPAATVPPSYSLSVGWNLVGFKPQPTIAPATVQEYLLSIDGSYNEGNVWLYDNGAESWVRAKQTDTINPGQAMWILVTSPDTLAP